MIAATSGFGWLHDEAMLAPASGGRLLLVIALFATGAAILAAVVVGHVRRDRAHHGPVVRRLARGLGLSPRDWRLLARVARAARRPQAGSLLISRGCFDAAVRAYAARYRTPARLEAIRRSIFG